MLVIDLSKQRAMLYRNGVPIAASTVSTGRRGRETPRGVFTILQKKVVHRSRTYDDAPMPYMQRLTWKGVAMHAGRLPGYPASHGCIRLPKGFAKRLYGVTKIGTPVMITA
jgi:lipoprotein-anchoring transpeptidase ErfK/SrfK